MSQSQVAATRGVVSDCRRAHGSSPDELMTNQHGGNILGSTQMQLMPGHAVHAAD